MENLTQIHHFNQIKGEASLSKEKKIPSQLFHF